MTTKHTPGPVTGPYHGPSISDQLRLIRALCGTDDPTGKAELRAAVAYVSVVTAEMLEALQHLMIDLEYHGLVDFYNEASGTGLGGAVADARAAIAKATEKAV